MRRYAPWLVLLVSILVGGALLYLRTRTVVAGGPPPGVAATTIVRNAYTLGKRVPLSGTQRIEMPNPKGGRVVVTAEVLARSDGDFRIRYTTDPLRGVTIWQNDGRTYRYNPHLKKLTASQRRPRTHDPARLLENYSAEIKGKAAVAGRSAWIVDLHPLTEGGRSKRLLVDTERWVILGSEDRADHGAFYNTRFTEVHYLDAGHDPAESEFDPPIALVKQYGVRTPGDTSKMYQPAELGRVVGFPLRLPKWLPRGYAFDGAYRTPSACESPRFAARLEYSDGLNRISLFECASPSCGEGESCFGELASMPLGFSTQKGDTHYLAIGDAPKTTLERIVESVSE